ncbi:MAG TPA: sugar phosphate isomerase/epimerase family protein [Bacteroidales bacterium]|nr:sugar phosphate isomerase/epimerase family protein [Bacteroidales bacterium]
MILGISSYTYTWAAGVTGHYPAVRLSHAGLLEKAVQLGVKVVQIADNMPLHELSPDGLDDLAGKAGELGIELEAGSNMMTPENIEKYIGIAERIRSKILRFVIDGPGYAPPLREIVSVIRNAEPELRRRKIVLALENHDRLFSHEFRSVIETVASRYVGICLDCANSLGAGEGIREVVGNLSPYVVNFHLKEIAIKRKIHRMGFDVEGVPFGKGMLPLEWILQQLTEKCRTAILELWTPPEPDILQTTEKENRWAEESIAWLKMYIKHA